MSMSARPTHVVRSVLDPHGCVQSVTVNLGESPLLWLYSRGHLDDRLFRAGEQLRSDWEAAGLGPQVTMHWDVTPPSRTRGGGRALASCERNLSARQRFDGALQQAGPGLSDILWRVVCAGEGLSAAEKALGWPSRAGKLVLTLALQRVAVFYRIQ